MTDYRRIAFNEHGRECSECDSSEAIEVHHIDGDRNNNEPENLLPLCRRCHSKVHGSGLNGLEDQLKPPSERSHIDETVTTFGFTAPEALWNEWKETVPRSKSLEKRINELIEADRDGRVSDE